MGFVFAEGMVRCLKHRRRTRVISAETEAKYAKRQERAEQAVYHMIRIQIRHHMRRTVHYQYHTYRTSYHMYNMILNMCVYVCTVYGYEYDI